MARLVLIYKERHPPAQDLDRIRGLPGVQILDAELSHLMLVEADEARLRDAVKEMPGWTMSPETRHKLE